MLEKTDRKIGKYSINAFKMRENAKVIDRDFNQ